MKTFKGTFGPLVIEVLGAGDLFDRFLDEFQLNSDYKTGTTDLKIVLGDLKEAMHNFHPKISSAKRHMQYNANDFYYDQPVPFLCKGLFTGNRCTLLLDTHHRKRMRCLIRSMLSSKINFTSELSYSLLWYIIHILLLKKQSSFIHASALSYCEKGIAFMGTGGSGKTSLLFNMLNEKNSRYLSEDFGIINANGEITYSPKSLSIYESDISDGPEDLQHVYLTLNLFEKIKWKMNKYVLSRNPMKKIPVKKIIDDSKICSKIKLTDAYFIVRCDTFAPKLKEISSEEISERMIDVTLKEMKKLIELLNMINANLLKNYTYPSIKQLIDNTRKVYIGGFMNANNLLLTVPFHFSSNAIINFLKSEGHINISKMPF